MLDVVPAQPHTYMDACMHVDSSQQTCIPLTSSAVAALSEGCM